MAEVVAAPPIVAPIAVRRWRSDDFIKAFFGSNALIAIVVLGLITIFLFREGFGFFGQNLRNIRLYRRAGLEYVDIMRDAANAHAALSRGLNLTWKSAQTPESPETSARFSQFCPAPQKSWRRGIPTLRCQPTVPLLAFSSDASGPRLVFGRIGTGLFRCWLARSWFRSSRLPSRCPSVWPRLFT